MGKINELLLKYRTEHKLNLIDVSEKTGYSISYISMIENSKKPVPLNYVANLMKFCFYSDDEYRELLKAYIQEYITITAATDSFGKNYLINKGLDFIVDFIIKYPTITDDQFKKMHEILEEQQLKNRDKYMKQIYAMIPDKYILNIIGVDKKTGVPFECSNSKHGDCDKCLFSKNNRCIGMNIFKWLQEEEK